MCECECGVASKLVDYKGQGGDKPNIFSVGIMSHPGVERFRRLAQVERSGQRSHQSTSADSRQRPQHRSHDHPTLRSRCRNRPSVIPAALHTQENNRAEAQEKVNWSTVNTWVVNYVRVW